MSVRFDDLEVGRDLPSSSRLVTREDVKAYADASGDQNPLHQDDAAAIAAGFPTIVAHGMFTMGHLTSTVLAWAGIDADLLEMRAPFRAPVFVGETIVAGGTVTAVDDDARTATIGLWVRVERDGTTEWPIRKSEAVVRFA